MTASTMVGIAAQGLMPAGMLRIRQGGQERYVWPVHLPGWLAMGWRVAGSEPSDADRITAELPLAETPAVIETVDEDDAKPASVRGRRGRRRKDDSNTPEVVPPESVELEPLDDITAVPAVQDLPAPAEPEHEETTTDAELAIALPDDLFDDPLT